MNVLSLFDGISCGQLALQRLGVKVDNYFASEIDKFAIQVTQHHFPNTIQLGDVTQVKGSDLPKIDLLIGGSPCQGFSFLGKRLDFEDPRSKLFFEYVRLLKECKPKYFLLENVKMKQECKDIISEQLGVEPIMINSALVSAQNRKRLYWTNIPNVTQPEDKGILLKDIVENPEEVVIDREKSLAINKSYSQSPWKHYKTKAVNQMLLYRLPHGYITEDFMYVEKYPTLCAQSPGTKHKMKCGEHYRTLTPLECERLQTMPDEYTDILKKTRRYQVIGNAWTVDVIVHILKNMEPESDIMKKLLSLKSEELLSLPEEHRVCFPYGGYDISKMNIDELRELREELYGEYDAWGIPKYNASEFLDCLDEVGLSIDMAICKVDKEIKKLERKVE